MKIPEITINFEEFLTIKKQIKENGIQAVSEDQFNEYRYLSIMSGLFKEPVRIKFIQFGQQLDSYSISMFSKPLGMDTRTESGLLAHLKQLIRYNVFSSKEEKIRNVTIDTSVSLNYDRFEKIINIITPLMQMKKQKVLN